MPIIKATTITRRLVTLRTGDKIMYRADELEAAIDKYVDMLTEYNLICVDTTE